MVARAAARREADEPHCEGCARRDEQIKALELRLRETDEVAAANWLELVDLRERLRRST